MQVDCLLEGKLKRCRSTVQEAEALDVRPVSSLCVCQSPAHCVLFSLLRLILELSSQLAIKLEHHRFSVGLAIFGAACRAPGLQPQGRNSNHPPLHRLSPPHIHIFKLFRHHFISIKGIVQQKIKCKLYSIYPKCR